MQLQRPPRDTRLDLLRGWLQIQIFASHAHGSILGVWFITSAWGLSDSSEQFVYLSGFALGSVFVLKAARGGFRAALVDLAHRIRRLHTTHLIVFCAFAALVISMEMAAPFPGESAAHGWTWLIEEPWLALPAGAALLYQPEFMGILPVFLFCMLALPLFWLGVQRFGAWALLPSAALYAAAHLFGWQIQGLGGTEIEFNPLAWQFLFLLGAWFGREALVKGRSLPRIPWLLGAALAMLAFGLWYRLVGYGWIPGPVLDPMLITDKQHLALPRLLHALSLAYVTVCLLTRRDVATNGWFSHALAATGRNSLNVFCIGLFLAYGASSLFRLHPAEILWLDLPLIGTGALLLLGFASLAERRKAQPA
jgi:hypothetical protein